MKITHTVSGKDGLTAALRIALTDPKVLAANAEGRAGGKYGKTAPKIEEATDAK